MQSSRGYRSLFWPIFLIGVGITWLMGNLGIIPSDNFYSLGRLWPLLLVVIGLDMLFGRRSTLGSAIIGLITVGIIAVFLVFAPSLGLAHAPSVTTSTYHEVIGQSASATVNLDLASARTSLYALSDSPDLINARIDHLGFIHFNVSGINQKKTIQLSETGYVNDWLNPANWGLDLRWDIGLTPKIPLDLQVKAGSGSGSLDFSKINLTGLKIDAASGSMSVVLPKTSSHYLVDIIGASGSLDLVAPCTDLEIRLDSASGSQTINLPKGCAVRVDVHDRGSGSINLPGNLAQVNGSSGSRATGAWENSGYNPAPPAILINITSAGSGSINIH
ncbi:MAG TPA: DUF5668 domain-containing protein [Anaerolineaceae bacterium]|jgi:hypothetical protein